MKFKRSLIYILIFLIGVMVGRVLFTGPSLSVGEAREQIWLMDELDRVVKDFYDEVERAFGE